MKAITLNSKIARNEANFMGGDMGSEMVMMDMETGDYVGLNEVGTTIWKLIEQPQNVQSICTSLMEAYDVDEATCQAETIKYLDQLAKEKMITVE